MFSSLLSYWPKRQAKNCQLIDQSIATDILDMPALNLLICLITFLTTILHSSKLKYSVIINVSQDT